MIQVVYACNDGYIDCLQLSILSIVRRTKQPIHFYVLTNNFQYMNPKFVAFSDEHEKAMKDFVKSFNSKNEFSKIDCNDSYSLYLKGNKNESSVCSPYTNLRLIMDQLNLSGKIIYLDTDTMCCGDISELNDIDLKGKSLAATRDHLARYWHPQTRKYFNAGVLVVDLNKSKQTGLFEVARKYLFNRKYKLADQTCLFKACKKTKSFMLLPNKFRYNTQHPKMLHNTLIKHFCSGWVHGRWQNIKQNDIDNVHEKLKIHTFDEDYEVWKKMKI